MNKKIVIALVSLVLLTSVICIASLNTVKADSVTVLSSSSFTDSSGNYNIVGEVQNTGSTWAYVLITATLNDAHGNALDTITQSAFLATLSPNGKSPFEITETTSTIVSQISTYTLSVKSSVSASIPQSLTITNSNTTSNVAGMFEVQGQIQNTGSATATATAIYATFYDSSGKVVETASGYPTPPDIPASATSPFVISPYDETQLSLFPSYSLVAISDNYISNYSTGSTGSSSSSTATPTTSTPTAASTSSANSPSSTTSTAPSPSPTPTVPEFPFLTLLPILAAVLLLSIVFIRKRVLKK